VGVFVGAGGRGSDFAAAAFVPDAVVDGPGFGAGFTGDGTGAATGGAPGFAGGVADIAGDSTVAA
jgi:hypothetical protein